MPCTERPRSCASSTLDPRYATSKYTFFSSPARSSSTVWRSSRAVSLSARAQRGMLIMHTHAAQHVRVVTVNVDISAVRAPSKPRDRLVHVCGLLSFQTSLHFIEIAHRRAVTRQVRDPHCCIHSSTFHGSLHTVLNNYSSATHCEGSGAFVRVSVRCCPRLGITIDKGVLRMAVSATFKAW